MIHRGGNHDVCYASAITRGAPPWPWEPGASDFDGTSTLEPSSKSSSDMALGRAREAAKDGEDLASELHGIDLSDPI